MQGTTPINDTHHKQDIIEHLNLDHANELFYIAKTYAPHLADIKSAQILDIFNEGLLLNITTQCCADKKFVAFELRGELEENVLYLAYKAMLAHNQAMGMNKTQYFEVLQNSMQSAHMLSLEVKSELAINAQNFDFAYLFELKKLQPTKIKANAKPPSLLFMKILLKIMRRISSSWRQKIMDSMYKYSRYYTVRSTWQQGDLHFAKIDIYIHGDSFGANFVRDLQAGDIIKSTTEYKGHTEHLTTGACLLIADETSMPALARMLENWQNPELPQVILVLHDSVDASYLADIELIKTNSINIKIFNYNPNVFAQLSEHIGSLSFAKTWGGLEAELAKKLRHHFRNQQLNAKNNRLTAYWK